VNGANGAALAVQPTGSSPSLYSDEHRETGPQSTENQPLALAALDAHQDTVPPGPAFASLTASDLWCPTCRASVSFRMLTQLDGTEVYLCDVCDTEVGQKRSMEASANNSPPAPQVVYPCITRAMPLLPILPLLVARVAQVA